MVSTQRSRLHSAASGEKQNYRWMVVIFTTLITVLWLYGIRHAEHEVKLENGVYVLTKEQLEEEVWLLSNFVADGNRQLELSLGGEEACFLMVGSRQLAQKAQVNGKDPEILKSGRYYLILLPPEERRLSIRYYDERYSSLSIASNPIYVGNREKILDRLDREKKLTNSLSGAFLFSVLFSVSMFLMKRSEKYLLFYAIHALIPQLFTYQPFFSSWYAQVFPGGNAVTNFLGLPSVAGFLTCTYVFLNLLLHWLIYREFVEDRIGGRPYPFYLSVSYLIFAVISLFTRAGSHNLPVVYLLYLFGYILEGAMLLINRVREGGEGFRLTLLAGWTVSFIVWLVRCANNLGLYSYPVSLGSYVAMGYTISFLFCINARFAGKYQQAEELLTEKTLLSQNLERQVTERTADLEEALTAVKKSEKTRRQFTMNIIHNLKTPLFSIQGYTELLSEEMKEADETAREYLSCVSGNVEYVQKLISQLLLIDRIEEKRITYQFHPISLSGFLDRLIATESAVLQDKKLQLETDNLLPADFMFEGDAFYLAQALLNILDNAIRHSPEGGKIRMTAQAASGEEFAATGGNGTDLGYFAISIRDYGEGMTESVRNHIFERGYSYHTDGGKSSGLGLNIALGIVREHGGDIRVQSEPGKGSCFEVILPQKQEEEHGMLS